MRECPMTAKSRSSRPNTGGSRSCATVSATTDARELVPPARPMRDSGIPWLGDVPEGWEIERLQWHLQEIVAKNNPIQTTNVLSLTNDKGVIPYSEKGNIGNKAKEDYSEYKLAYRGTIVANSMNILIGSVDLSKYDGCVSPVYYVFKGKEGSSIKYFHYLFQLPSFQKELRRYANGILEIRLRVSSSDILKRRVAIPPLSEQRVIADYLDKKCAAIDAAVAEAKRGIEEYKAWKKSLIFEAVTGKIAAGGSRSCANVSATTDARERVPPARPMRDSGIPWLGDVPEEWEIGKIGALYTHRNEKVSDKEFPPLSVTMKGVVPQLATAAKSDDGDNRKLVCKGDFAINSRSDRRGSCGISAYDGSVSLINTILKPRDEMNPVYYNWLFHTEAFADEFYKWGHGIVDDLWTTRWSEMKRMVIPLPPLSEQRAIADYLDKKCAAIDALVAEKEALIADLEAYKKSLIFEVVTGKKEVA